MKYTINDKRVAAIYDNSGTRNPLIEALPEQLTASEFKERIASFPVIPNESEFKGIRDAKIRIEDINNIFVPLNYMYQIYDTIFRMIRSTYNTLTSRERVMQINTIYNGKEGGFTIQAESGSVLGTPGLGKTTTIARCLNLIPQVIEHKSYLNEPFFTKQILWLFVQCPSDSSAKSFSFNVVKAIDEAVGSNNLEYLMKIRSQSTSAIATYLKILCLNYNVGLICIDEIQNLVIEAKRSNRVKSLVRFLTELTNESGTSILFSGTNLAESVFSKEEYLRRRTRGLRLLPFRADGVYRDFIKDIWDYQYTKTKAALTEKIANQIYDLSGGIPSYIVKIFKESQIEALNTGEDEINSKVITDTVNKLAIKPPLIIEKGMCLSDFKATVDDEVKVTTLKTGKMYAHKRGRKVEARDEDDLLVAFKEKNVLGILNAHEMLEEMILC